MKINFNWLKNIYGLGAKPLNSIKKLFNTIVLIFNFRFIKLFSIRYKLIGFFLIVSVVPIVMIGLISYTSYREAMVKKSAVFASQEVSHAVNNLELQLNGYENTINLDLNKTLTDLISSKKPNAAIDDNFRKRLALDKMIKSFYFYSNSDKNNFEVVSSLAEPSFTAAQLKNSKIFHETGQVNYIYWDSTAALDSPAKDLVAGKVIRNETTAEKSDILFMIISEDGICNYVNPHYQPEQGSNYYILIDHTGKILSSPYKDTLGRNIFGIIKHAGHLQAVLNGNGSSNTDFSGINHQEALVTSQQCGKHGWYLLNIEPTGALFQEVNYIGWLTLLLGLFFSGAAILISIYVSNQISNSVGKIADAMKLAENGDLTTRVTMDSHDEFEYLGGNFNRMLSQISQLIIDVQAVINKTKEQSTTLEDNANLSVKNTENVADAMADISKGTIDQINEVGQASLFMSELADDIGTVVAKAADVEIITDMTKNLSFRSKEAILNLINKAKGSAEITNTVIKDIEDLNASAVEIGNITEIIADIAEKSNLLALNAAIEAARAGEAGRGFEIVAKEINKLAVQSQAAAQSIEDLLQVVKSKTGSSAKNIDRAYLIVGEQAEAVQMAEGAFEAIIKSMDEVIIKMTEMSVFVQKVDSFKERTLQSIFNISAVSEETAAAAEEVTAASEEETSIATQIQNSIAELRAMAEQLVDLIEKFKVSVKSR